MRPACRFVLVLIGLAASLAAQRTWIVDVANPPGTDFTDLPPAEAAAAHGDTLLVRAGNYTAFATSKGIAVLGAPGTVVVGNVFMPSITVSALPAGRVFRARSLTLGGGVFGQSMVLNGNDGAVHLEAIDATAGGYPPSTGAIGISTSRLVTIVNCGHQSTLAVNLAGARVSIAHCRLQGRAAISDPRAGASWAAAVALNVQGGVVDVADSTLAGGAGASIWPHVGQYWASAPAIHVANALSPGTLRFRAGAVGDARAGVGVNPATPTSAITGDGVAMIDSRITLASYAGAPLIAPTVQASIGLVPGLSLVGGALGGNLVLTHHGQAAQPCLAAIGVVGAVLVFPFGDLVLELGTMQTLPVVFADGLGVATWNLPLPVNLSLVGLAFTWQVGSDAGGLMLSNPASVILR